MAFCLDGGYSFLAMQKKRFSSCLRPHKKRGSFYNHPHEVTGSLIGRLYRLMCDGMANRVRFARHDATAWLLPTVPPERSRKLLITWIGHSTFLIQIAGCNILTDPIFGAASPLFPRLVDPGLALAALPPIDLVLLSHNHYDHMHAPSLKALEKVWAPQFLVPAGDKRWFDRHGFGQCHEHTWWEQRTITIGDQKLTCSFLPAYHWSQRGLFDRNRSLWGSWMVETGQQAVYFAGDSAEGDHFAQIGKEFSHIDAALMPVAPCEPHAHMKESHLDAHQAGDAFIQLGANQFIPMHWGTFFFGTDRYELPIERLQTWWATEREQLAHKTLSVLKIGQQLTVE